MTKITPAPNSADSCIILPVWFGVFSFSLISEDGLFAEVAVQQTGKRLAVPGFVARHLINHFAALVIAGERITAEKALLFRRFKFVF